MHEGPKSEVSCTKRGCLVHGRVVCSKYASFKELFVVTDRFINTMEYVYDPYYEGARSVTSADGCFTVKRMGSLIVVSINATKTAVTYREMADALSARYVRNKKVVRCFVNASGTVSIKCAVIDSRLL